MEEKLEFQIFNCILVGRPNVGKSSIFNFVLGKHEAFVRDEDGTTQDWRSKRIGNIVIWDTPGVFSIENMPPCNVDKIVFVIENNVLNSDKDLFIQLKKQYKDITVIVNKVDLGEDEYSFFGNEANGSLIKISLKSRVGLYHLKSLFFENYRDLEEKKKKIWAIIGKPNVGKSSIANLLAGAELHKVKDEDGTTKEFLPIELDENIMLDTPGQRHKALFPRYGEIFGILFVIDLKQHRQDLKLIGMAVDRKKPIVVVINKTDLAQADEVKIVEDKIRKFWDVPIIKVSCLKKKNIDQIKQKITQMESAYYKRIKTSELNSWLTMHIKKIEPKIKFISQIESAPPKFFVDFKLLDDKEKMLKRRLSNYFQFDGIPIAIKYKEKDK